MEVKTEKHVERKPFVHVDILAELSKVREEKLDQLRKEEENQITDDLLANLLGRTSVRTSEEVALLVKRIEQGNVFTNEEIKAVAQKFALKFADASRFKGKYPKEALEALKKECKGHNQEQIKILAPSAAFEMNYYSDPVMFIGDRTARFSEPNTWKVVHKWGNDFTVLRRLLSRDYKALQAITMAVLAVLCIIGAVNIWFHQFSWYIGLPVSIIGGVLGIMFFIYFCCSLARNPEPFFYDANQWNRVDVSTD